MARASGSTNGPVVCAYTVVIQTPIKRKISPTVHLIRLTDFPPFNSLYILHFLKYLSLYLFSQNTE